MDPHNNVIIHVNAARIIKVHAKLVEPVDVVSLHVDAACLRELKRSAESMVERTVLNRVIVVSAHELKAHVGVVSILLSTVVHLHPVHVSFSHDPRPINVSKIVREDMASPSISAGSLDLDVSCKV